MIETIENTGKNIKNFFPETKISMPNIEIYKELSTGSKNMIISIAKTELLISLDKLIDRRGKGKYFERFVCEDKRTLEKDL